MDIDLKSGRRGARVLDTFVDSLSIFEALEKVDDWARVSISRYVCFCNVHSLVTASNRADLELTLRQADLVLPDGAPVTWMLRYLGFRSQKRISGPEFMWQYCDRAQRLESGIFLFGSEQATLEELRRSLRKSFPGLRVAGTFSPPFGPVSAIEDEAIVQSINSSGAGLVFVSLGCPKQELWMSAHRDRINAVMLGVGAAFDYHAGSLYRPPMWVEDVGLEWLVRLYQEPKRLWKRYLVANSIFICRATLQIIGHATTHLRGALARPSTDQVVQPGSPMDRVDSDP
jgi:N-acetylglucosaminyldiphosphoundecaprenol N-acetyl-beta-D-mannosaminyltransferase